jgi:hypothetical protein
MLPSAITTFFKTQNLSNLKIIAKALKAKLLVNSDYYGTTFGLAIPVIEVMKKGSNKSRSS